MRLLVAGLAALVAMVAGPALAEAQPGITNPNGSVAVSEQVALVSAPDRDIFHGQFCSGTIRDALHVITAAHCVEPPMDVPSALRVVAGVTNLATPEATMQQRAVSAISSFPDYAPRTSPAGDAAILTLDAPLTLGGAVTAYSGLGAAVPGTVGFVAGWGVVNPATPNLFSATLLFGLLDVYDDAACSGYGADYVPAMMVCAQGHSAAGTVIDTCQGDSGGPLDHVSSPGAGPIVTDALIGITSFGSSCGDPAFPGVYTEVGHPAISAFLSQPSPAQRPVVFVPPTIGGASSTPAAGADVRCLPGTWAGDPSFAYDFMRFPFVNGQPDMAHAAEVAAPSASSTYRLVADDVGHGIFCIVRAGNAGGTRYASSDGVGPVAAIARGSASTTSNAAGGRDVSAPTSRFAGGHCVDGVCALHLLAADNRGLAGWTLGVRITRVGGCGSGRCRAALRRPARSHRTGTAGFEIRTARLPRGRYRIRAVLVDAAGNRQARPALILVRVR
jgi:trypsin